MHTHTLTMDERTAQGLADLLLATNAADTDALIAKALSTLKIISDHWASGGDVILRDRVERTDRAPAEKHLVP